MSSKIQAPRFASARLASVVAVGVLAAVMAGCASGPRHYSQQERQPIYAPYAQVGQVAAIDRIRLGRSPSGIGALIGGVAGAVVGNQFGKGGGRTGMTVLGAAGGAVAGNAIEGNRGDGQEAYRITVRMNDGNVRAFDYEQLGDIRLGDRVRVEDNRIFIY
ncbi:hypothetical protein BH09PSE5_BH09PSE5_45220 [soil metagenome]